MATTTSTLSTSNSDLPSKFALPLPFELATGRYVLIKWKPSNSDSFSFNFGDDEANSTNKNVQLHYNPRIAEGTVVRNAVVENAGWGAEERGGTMPYQVGVSNVTKLMYTTDQFECFVDGVKHCDFKIRSAVDTAKFFFIIGNGDVESVIFGDENNKLTVPLPYELANGRYVLIRWKPTNTSSYSFNFSETGGFTTEKNLPLHFNPRIATGDVVRNAIVANGGWGAEERGGTMPFQVGVTSETKIVVREDFYECFVDGVKHSEFRHRAPIETAKFLFIVGIGECESVVFGDEASEQESSTELTTPFETPCDISPGRKIYVTATPDANVNRFWIFLCADDDYVCVLTVKMKRKSIALNSRIGGKWKAKQRVKKFPFEAGKEFSVVIEVFADKYQVNVNGKHLADFSHRVVPLSRINELRVDERDGGFQLKRAEVV